jgi:hypothetical protein
VTLQQLWTRGAFVRVPSGATGMVRAFDRRTNMVAVQMAPVGMGKLHEAMTEAQFKREHREQDFIDLLRQQDIVRDHHFTTLRLGEQL